MPTTNTPGPITELSLHLSIEPWCDPVIDQVGHDPRSEYVERFWLAILGPSTVLLLRHMAFRLDAAPEGFTMDLGETARSIGVGMRGGRNSAFMRSVQRACRFGASRFVALDQLAVRRRLAPLTRHQVARLPQSLQAEHHAWVEREARSPSPEDLRRRARQLALSLLDLGEDRAGTERQLHRWRFHPALAHDAVRWAMARRAEQDGPVDDAG